MTLVRAAVVVDGPRWWGDPYRRVDGRPVRLEDATVRAARKATAEAEAAALLAEVDRLPAGCVVVHTGARGAAFHFGQAATAAGLPLVAAPALRTEAGEDERNDLVVTVARGLVAAGYAVKALLATSDDPAAVAPETEDLRARLVAADVFVRPVLPLYPEPEADPPSA